MTSTDEMSHNLSTYTNHKCRCDECRAANADYMKRRRAERVSLLAQGLVDPVHGKATTYANYRCHCGPCLAAWAAYERSRRAK
jgi:alcohol dehydrogenase class IV